MPRQNNNAASLILTCEDEESFFTKTLILTRCLYFSTWSPLICRQIYMGFLWHAEEGESFCVKALLHHNSTWWIYSPCKKLECQKLVPLGRMTHPLVIYLNGMSHMALLLYFWIKIGDKGMRIIEKNLEKIWEKGKKNWVTKIARVVRFLASVASVP